MAKKHNPHLIRHPDFQSKNRSKIFPLTCEYINLFEILPSHSACKRRWQWLATSGYRSVARHFTADIFRWRADLTLLFSFSATVKNTSRFVDFCHVWRHCKCWQLVLCVKDVVHSVSSSAVVDQDRPMTVMRMSRYWLLVMVMLMEVDCSQCIVSTT